MTRPGPDAVALDLWAPDRELFAAVRVDLRGGERVAAALVANAGDVTTADSATAEIGDAHVRVEAGETRLECELRPRSAPVDMSAPASATVARAAGLSRHVQAYELEGTFTTAGKATPLRATGVRAHASGDAAGARRRRFVSAATADGRLVAVMAVRLDASMPHGEELVAGYVVDPESDAATPFEEVRLSTVYAADGLPRTAGVELYRPGDELPARLSGEAILSAPLEVGGTAVSISFFRWTLTGSPAWGTYELEPKT
jgi:hypothetical protein